MKEGEQFSGSEEFAKSLEPSYTEPVHPRPVRSHTHQYHHGARHAHHSPEQGQDSSVVVENEEAEMEKPGMKKSDKLVDPHHHHRRKGFEIFMAVYLVALFIFIFALAASTDSNPFIVLVALLPTMFTMFVAMFIYEAKPNNKNVLWPIPLVVVLFFYFLATSFGGGILAGLDVDTLAGVNMFTAYLYIIINYFIVNSSPKSSKPKVKVIVKEAPPEDISQFIASIEDKSKALNFVIGRVYNAYHGGSKELREKINMKQDWYDQFSKVPSDPDAIDFKALSKLLTAIELRLKKLEKSEAEVFGADHASFRNLVRSADGADRVIDVLDRNDKDPVKSYYDGALQFVQKIRDFMLNRQIPEVENEYVERPDDKTPAPRSSTWHKAKELLK